MRIESPGFSDSPAARHVRLRAVGQMLRRPDIATIVPRVVVFGDNVPPGAVLIVREINRKRRLFAFAEF